MSTTTPTSTLLFLNLPPKTFLGIDLLSFNTSPNFHGIKEVAAGIHFIYSGTDASLSIRHGLWLNLTTNLYVFQWNSQEEAFSSVPPESEIAQHAASTLHSSKLVDYAALLDASRSQSQSPTDWPLLISHISLKTLTRIFPTITPTFPISSISSAPADSSHEHIPGLSSSEVTSAFDSLNETPLNFLHINLKQTWPLSAVGRDRTDAARDRSWYLSHLMEGVVPAPHGRAKAAGEVVGELQLCFVMVLTLANYSCLEQWKRILGVVLTCRKAVGEVEEFFVEVLQLLRLQLRHCEDVEGGLFEFEVGGGGWLRGLLRGFKAVIEEVGSRKLAEEMSEIEDLMREVYGWEVESAMLRRGVVELEDGERAELSMEGADEEDEMGEYAPVYVDT
jgi:A1 cistron-splicing factor AAR2